MRVGEKVLRIEFAHFAGVGDGFCILAEFLQIDSERRVRLLDFGIARLLEDSGDDATATAFRALTPGVISIAPDLANAVADQQIYSSIRTDQDTQRLSVPTRIGVRHPKLSQVIQMMEANIEEPISPSILAKDVGMSTRQLERLFRRYLTRSPKRYYMELRLQKARNLLMQTDMSVINVALACGFASPSHFSKCYRAHYDTTPYRERGSHAARLSI